MTKILIADEVIEQGKNIQIPDAINGSNLLGVMLDLVITVAILVLLLVAVHYVTKKIKNPKIQHTLLLGVIILFAATTATSYILSVNHSIAAHDEYRAEVHAWKQDFAYPYIAQQTYTDYDLASIEYTNKSDKEFVIKYIDDKYITGERVLPDGSNHVYQIHYDVPIGEKPFVRFYDLYTDLGHGVEPGAYGVEVYMNLAPKQD